MAFPIPELCVSFRAKATLAANTAVVIDTDGQLIQATADGPMDGLITEGVVAGDDVKIVALGPAFAVSGAAIANTVRALKVGTTGRLITFVPYSIGGGGGAAVPVQVANFIRSEAKLSAAGADEQIRVILIGSPANQQESSS